jgi:Na+-transporting NADH:ubiquinone oxidoreductase subunit B
MNIFNPAIAARMFLFFAYPSKMTGDQVWVAQNSIFGLGNDLPDGFTAATPLGQMAQGIRPDASIMDMVLGFIPGSIGETSLIAIAIGAVILLWTGIASWRTMLSVFAGGAVLAIIFEQTGSFTYGCEIVPWWRQFVMGGFAFGAVFMATDPVTSCRTTTGQYIYGFLIGAMAIIIRVMNAGYPEGMMLAIFFGNMFAPTIDHFVVARNISKRLKRGGTK